MNNLYKFAYVQLSAILIAFNFFANLANDAYLPSMSHLTTVFETTPNMMQLTMTAWFAGIAFPQLFFGPLSDKLGRKPILLGGSICFIVATIFCILAANLWIFISARFFQGIGVCCLNVSSYSIFADLYESKQRCKVINIMNACASSAPLIGPIIGGYIFIWLGWRANFIFIGFLSLLCVVGLIYLFKESHLNLNHHALKIKNLIKNYGLVVKSKSFIKYIVPYCLILGGSIAYLTASPFIFIREMHIPTQWFGYTQAPIFIAFIAGAGIVFFFEKYYDYHELLVIGLWLIFSSSITLLIGSFILHNHLYFIIICMMLYSLGMGLSASPLLSEGMEIKANLKGYVAALLGFCMAFSCMLFSFLLSLIYREITSLAFLLVLVSVLTLLLYLMVKRKYS